MDDRYFIRNIPRVPGIYVMRTKTDDIAYVGLSSKLRDRIDQHLYLRDSSVTTGVQATVLNPDQIAQVDYWQHPIFEDADVLRAAEFIAFEVFKPALRSRGRISKTALAKLQDELVVGRIRAILNEAPSGSHIPQNVRNIWRLVECLSEALADLHREISSNKGDTR